MKYPQVVSMPSAVSDWLEEQLEARGIDSVVYTRYILSLLHRDSADVICPDQDSCFAHSCKEVRRSGANRKRLRRTNDWWTYDQTDVDQLKRSAAVECLMSASDQKYGIESLVDELCEKLKEINNDSNADIETANTTPNYKEASPQELANQYYAAFPPLTRKSTTNSPGVITLIPKWIASPKKKQLRKPHNRSASFDDKFHYKANSEHLKARLTGKTRFNRKNNMGGCPKKMDGENEYNIWGFNSYAKSRLARKQNELKKSFTANQDDKHQFEDLFDNIEGLLKSPEPQENDKIRLMNSANMRDTGKKSSFIQCGTNITSSIWTTTSKGESFPATVGLLLEQNVSRNIITNSLKTNELNDFESNGWHTSDDEDDDDYFVIERNNKTLLNYPWGPYGSMRKWSNAEPIENEENVAIQNLLTKSFKTLNHHKESSVFTEVTPRATSRSSGFDAFGKSSATYFFKPDVTTRKVEPEKDKEDLLTSLRSHFKPITEKPDVRPWYADGTSFVIPSTLDEVNYKRSESGAMYIDSEYGFAKKYKEYKTETLSVEKEFTLKFHVCQNDKACQTDFDNVDDNDDNDDDDIEEATFVKEDQPQFNFQAVIDNLYFGSGFKENFSFFSDNRSDSISSSRVTKRCKQCNSNTTAWGGSMSFDMWKDRTGDNIWNEGDVCLTCLNENCRYKALNEKQRSRMMEDISSDSEELFSDLSKRIGELANTVTTCDISDMIEPKDRKRGLSNFCDGSSSWSFASRLKEDCLIQMSTMPTLRAVTL